MTGSDALKSTLTNLINLEITRLVPAALHAVPIVGAVLDELWQTPAIQAKAQQWETQGVDWALQEAAKGVGDLEQLAINATRGKVKTVLGDAIGDISMVASRLSLNASQVALIAPLIEKGQLEQALKAGAAALGITL